MEHPATQELAAYLEHRLDDASRGRVESHLVECDQCRRDVVDGERVLRSAPGRRTAARRPVALRAGLAAAAALLLTVLPRDEPRDGQPVERGPDAPVGTPAPAIVVVEPTDATRLTAPPATFVWRRAPGVSLYKFTLTDEQGRVLWSASTQDTVLKPPASLVAPTSARYYWYVDALRADGSAVSSGVQAFRVR